MRTAIILGRKHGGKSLVIVSGPEIPVREQRARFKDYRREGSDSDLESVELWESDRGCVKEAKLDHPDKSKNKSQPRPPKPVEHPKPKARAHAHGRDKDEVE